MIKLIAQAVVILIEMVIEYAKPLDTAGYETFEKYRHQINKLNEIKSKLEDQ